MVRKLLLCFVAILLLALFACAAPEDAQFPCVRVAQGEQTITPFENFVWGSDGKTEADGIALGSLLPALARELPQLGREAAFEVVLPENGELGAFSVYDEGYGRVSYNLSQSELADALAAAQGSVCYVSFEVIYRDVYDASTKTSRTVCNEYVFALAA